MPDGVLVLVGTPIGNLGDLSPRAVRALAEADLIACEDTRRTRALLSAAGVAGARLVSVREHNEASMVPELVAKVRRGMHVALVTDAGMPGVSDPGERVVRAIAEAGLHLAVVPGPSAVTAALVVSGFATRRWCFEGFLPVKGRERAERLAALAAEPRTVVLYEAPHRLAATLGDLARVVGPLRRVAVVRELTKVFEDVWRGTLREAADRAVATGAEAARGEHVIVLEGAPEAAPPSDEQICQRLEARLSAGGASRREVVAEVATGLGVSKRRVYDLALRLP